MPAEGSFPQGWVDTLGGKGGRSGTLGGKGRTRMQKTKPAGADLVHTPVCFAACISAWIRVTSGLRTGLI